MAPPSGLSGSETCATPSSPRTASSDFSTAARCAASVSLPLSVLNTIVASAPASAGVCSRKRSIASWDSVPGTAKSSAAGPPAVPARPPRTKMVRIATTRLRFQRWVSVRARRARRSDMATTVPQLMQKCNDCNFALDALSGYRPVRDRPARAQEGTDARADRAGGDEALRRARIRPDDDQRHRRGRGDLAADVLRLLPLQGGRGLPRRGGDAGELRR